MNISDYTMFTVLAKELNFTKAASRLFISTQALSKRILNLEDYYGVTLFERKPKVKLTYAGERLLQYYNDVAILESKARDEIKAIANQRRGMVKIGISFVRDTSKLSQIIAKYNQIYPDIQITIVDGLLNPLLQQLLNHTIDMVISVSTVDSADVQYEVISNECSHLYISDSCLNKYCNSHYKSLIQAEKESSMVSISEFKNCPFLLQTTETRARLRIDKAFAACNFEPQNVIFANSIQFRMDLVQQGIGATIFNSSVDAPVFDGRPDIHVFRLLELSDITQVKLSYMLDRYIPQYAFDLIDMIIKDFQ